MFLWLAILCVWRLAVNSGNNPKESAKAYQAYLDYRDMGDGRSLAKLNNQYGKKPSYIRQLQKWSAEHDWQSRIKQFSQEQAEERSAKLQAEIDEMNERHVRLAIEQQEKATKQIQSLINAESFGSQAVVQLLKLATDLERLARGAPTEREEITGKDGSPVQVIFMVPKKGGDA